MFNKEYYENKLKQQETKFQQLKDKMLGKFLAVVTQMTDLNNDFNTGRQEIQLEINEINNIIKENKMEDQETPVVEPTVETQVPTEPTPTQEL